MVYSQYDSFIRVKRGCGWCCFHSALSCSPVSYTRLMNLTVMLQWIISSFSPVTLNWQLSSSGSSRFILNRSWFGSKMDSRNFNSAFSPTPTLPLISSAASGAGGRDSQTTESAQLIQRERVCARAAEAGGEKQQEGWRERAQGRNEKTTPAKKLYARGQEGSVSTWDAVGFVSYSHACHLFFWIIIIIFFFHGSWPRDCTMMWLNKLRVTGLVLS